MTLTLRKFLTIIGVFALLIATVLSQWRYESIRRFYSGALRIDLIPDLVTFQTIHKSVSIVRVGEGTELSVFCISHTGSTEELLEKVTLGPGLYCISMVSDERQNLFGYCVNGELHVLSVGKQIVGAFRSGQGVTPKGIRNDLWSVGSVDKQQDWTIEVEWNIAR
ncbi:MAG: hypothetical protein J0M26_29505 [Planctomycetes bacterium]|nr:hypothetical protein [Planctomycetota bacterium]